MEIQGRNIESVFIQVDTIGNLENALSNRRKDTDEDEWWLQ